jgi:hypothetical protein
MRDQQRRAARAAWKERKAPVGVYALRCAATGQVWVGASPNLDTLQNRIWFTLRQDNNSHRSLQAAWNAHGEAAFTFEELERLEHPPADYALRKLLDERRTHWAEQLAGHRI